MQPFTPSQANQEPRINLEQICIQNTLSSYYFRLPEGCAAAGIPFDALLVVDTLGCQEEGSIIVAQIDGEFVLRRVRLMPDIAYEKIEHTTLQHIQPLSDGVSPCALTFFGVVRYAVSFSREKRRVVNVLADEPG